MGRLTCPIPEQNFNGLIVMKRLHNQHVIEQYTHWQHFSVYYDINEQLKMENGINSTMTQCLPPMNYPQLSVIIMTWLLMWQKHCVS